MSAVFVLNTIIVIGILVTAVCAVVFENTLSSVLALGSCGAFVALEFIMLQAPDVAIAEAAVGAVLSTTIFVIAVKKTTPKQEEER
ncbi:MAG: DUF4040 domain-containing protein [Lachnospiraceae bacterium]|nr:DUF4040 domain-containing protein [Lachnospiraceae bacterium]MBQ6903891.1 DUF4040 domain-containing protein [Lachnospiraceae bacterium]